MEFASVIWDPSTADNINKLEMVQPRSASLSQSSTTLLAVCQPNYSNSSGQPFRNAVHRTKSYDVTHCLQTSGYTSYTPHTSGSSHAGSWTEISCALCKDDSIPAIVLSWQNMPVE